jgi:hypothetical protein
MFATSHNEIRNRNLIVVICFILLKYGTSFSRGLSRFLYVKIIYMKYVILKENSQKNGSEELRQHSH